MCNYKDIARARWLTLPRPRAPIVRQFTHSEPGHKLLPFQLRMKKSSLKGYFSWAATYPTDPTRAVYMYGMERLKMGP